jgi:hypothetical protein
LSIKKGIIQINIVINFDVDTAKETAKQTAIRNIANIYEKWSDAIVVFTDLELRRDVLGTVGLIFAVFFWSAYANC